MPKYYHDTDLKEKDWWIELDPIYKSLLHWVTMSHSSSGLYSLNIKKFCRDYMKGTVNHTEIDIDEFVRQCNEDKERMLKVDGGRKLFYTPTIKFQNTSSEVNHAELVNNFKFIGIVVQLAGHPETVKWTIEQTRQKKLRFKKDLLSTIIDNKGKRYPKVAIEMCLEIVRIMGFSEPEPSSKEDKIKKRDTYTCQYCGQKDSPENLEIDHIHPKLKGGDERADNLITSCKSCNKVKATDNVIKFLFDNGLEPSGQAKKQISSLINRGVFHYPSDYPIIIGIRISISNQSSTSIPVKNLKEKKIKKEKPGKLYSFDQVQNIHFNDKTTLTQQDFEITDEAGKDGRKLWKRKNDPP